MFAKTSRDSTVCSFGYDTSLLNLDHCGSRVEDAMSLYNTILSMEHNHRVSGKG